MHRPGRHSGLAGVGLGEGGREALAPQDEDEAVLLHRLDEDLHAFQADGPQALDQTDVDLGGDAAGPA
ncbi:MAG: hypothetical protein C4312_07590, partial [Thermoflexus sp.]